ncbi:hypothetical protein BH20ACT11_BH20ACT11_10280 [soil metagenome]
MSVTKKGRRWELLHSLWVGWTFTLGFFNWIAFLYIGVRSNNRRWLYWGGFYSIPFILALLHPDLEGWSGNMIMTLLLGLGVVSIVHAFLIRKDYLSRLAMLQRDPSSSFGTHETSDHQRVAPPEAPIQTKEVAQPPEIGEVSTALPNNGADAQDVRTISEPVRQGRSQSVRQRTESDNSSETREVAPSSKQDTGQTRDRDELENLISTSYPFPLAFGFRSLASIVDARDLYREQLRIAENMLSFLASVSLSLLREHESESEIVDLEQFWRSGISPGDWKDIIGRCSKNFVGYEEHLAQSINKLNIRAEKKKFGADVSYLIRAKNDYKHDRGPKILEDFKKATSEAQESLLRCMQALEFFTKYPIRQVEDFDVSRNGDKFFLKCLRYMGDHPSFHQEEVEFHKGVPRGDLLMDLGNGRWMSLYPFIATMNCPHCKVRETYFVDMWDTRRSVAKMKSFERGHTEDSAEVSETLAEIQRETSSSQ